MTPDRNEPMPGPGGDGGSTSRRGFLARLVAICGGAIVFVTSGISVATFISPVFGRRSAGWVRVGRVNPESDVFPRSVPVSFHRNDGWLTGTGSNVIHLARDDGGNVVALSSTCTHLGCRTRWDRASLKFLCPCHGGAYDVTGKVVAGPPPRPLARLEMRYEDDVLFVRGEDLGA